MLFSQQCCLQSNIPLDLKENAKLCISFENWSTASMAITLSWGITALDGSEADMVLTFYQIPLIFARNPPAGSL